MEGVVDFGDQPGYKATLILATSLPGLVDRLGAGKQALDWFQELSLFVPTC